LHTPYFPPPAETPPLWVIEFPKFQIDFDPRSLVLALSFVSNSLQISLADGGPFQQAKPRCHQKSGVSPQFPYTFFRRLVLNTTPLIPMAGRDPTDLTQPPYQPPIPLVSRVRAFLVFSDNLVPLYYFLPDDEYLGFLLTGFLFSCY